MTRNRSENDEVLQIGNQVTALPVVHGSGDFAWEVRRRMLSRPVDCLAIPLPASFQGSVIAAILELPHPSVVYQRDWTAFGGEPEIDDQTPTANYDPGINYVPIDPCQPVIAAIRLALEEHWPIRFIDIETSRFVTYSRLFPDPYALKKVSLSQYAASVLPVVRPPRNRQRRRRIEHLAFQLKNLCVDFQNIVFVCDLLDWIWIRQAFFTPSIPAGNHEPTGETQRASVRVETLYFMLGELPFVTGLYERARRTLEPDHNLSIDGVKELLLAARAAYDEDFGKRARKITPKLLGSCLKYIRNLSLIEHAFSPQLTTIVTAAQQTAGDQFAMHVLETAKTYPYTESPQLPPVDFGIGRVNLPNGETVPAVSRLPGPPVVWKTLKLCPRPEREKIERWKLSWNPYSQCSWPPEDKLIENFRSAVFDRAQQLLGQDLAKTEKFTTSVKDGIDIRDTLRHWYEGDIYVKVMPPNRGKLDAVVMLFDSPADPREYRWRATWYAEHDEESTLAFFATDFRQQQIGPGICLSTYGGAIFLFPPIAIPEIWHDERFNFSSTLEERLLAAACCHSRSQHVALLSSAPPGRAWRRIAKHFRRQLVHVPLGQFSDQTVQQLRMVHVLNGKQVRSYAADFIRRA